MNIDQARSDRTHLMNVTDMLEIARNAGEPIDPKWGEPKRALRVAAAYYGGFNTAGDTRNFDRVRGQ